VNGSLAVRRIPGWLKVCLASVAVQLLVFTFIAVSRPAYLVDYKTNANPDARHYVLLGHNFWLNGAYSRQSAPPYMPDMLRTPVYPLLAGGVEALFGVIWPLYALQILFGAATAGLVFHIADLLFGRPISMIAGFLYAADLMAAVLNMEAMSESLFTLLSTLCVFMWLRNLTDRKIQPVRQDALKSAAVGLILGIAILTRPTALYLAVVLFAVEGIVRWKGRRSLVVAPVLILTAALVIAPWIVRNQRQFGLARLTNVDTIALVYFVAAGAYQVEYGIEREDAQKRIAQEFGLASVVKTYNPWTADQSVASMDAKQRAAAKSILLSHPTAVLKASAIGIARATVAPNAAELASAGGRVWMPMGLGSVLTGKFREAATQLSRNGPFITAVFLWQVFLAIVTLPLAMVGVWAGLKRPDARLVTMCLLCIIGYFAVTIAVIGIDAPARQRSAVVPILCVFAGAGVGSLGRYVGRWKRRS